MKSTGIVRNVDTLGRIVIPQELRDKLGIKIKDPIEILTNGNSIIFRKYNINCVLCGKADKLVKFEEQLLCSKCIEQLKKL